MPRQGLIVIPVERPRFTAWLNIEESALIIWSAKRGHFWLAHLSRKSYRSG
jgi:hypothetical protein